MKIPEEVMPEATASLFTDLQKEPLLGGFILIGGTALSLHLGHRLSEDLDFIFLPKKLPREILRLFIANLQSKGRQVERSDDPQAYDEFQIAGMELHDFSQSFIVDNKIKLTFFVADIHHEKVLAAPTADAKNFTIASIEEIFSLKALVVSSRSTSRDWIDLYFLVKNHGFSLDQWHAVYQRADYSETQFETALNRICSGKLALTDPGFESLLPSPPTVEEIAAFFTEKRREYEVRKAGVALRKKHH